MSVFFVLIKTSCYKDKRTSETVAGLTLQKWVEACQVAENAERQEINIQAGKKSTSEVGRKDEDGASCVNSPQYTTPRVHRRSGRKAEQRCEMDCANWGPES